MSCRIFVARTDTGAWSLWIETHHVKASTHVQSQSTGISLSLAHIVESTPNPLSLSDCTRAIVVGWLPDHSFAQHRAWAHKFFEEQPEGDSLEFVLRILDDAYVEHYLDVVPTRETLEALLAVDDREEATRTEVQSFNLQEVATIEVAV